MTAHSEQCWPFPPWPTVRSHQRGAACRSAVGQTEVRLISRHVEPAFLSGDQATWACGAADGVGSETIWRAGFPIETKRLSPPERLLGHNINMGAIASKDSRLAGVTKICLALPEATRRDSGSHAAFLVRKSIFAYFLNDHHGDGIVSVACKALPGDNTALTAAQPARFYLPPYIGPRGWIALRLDNGEVDWDEVAELVVGSYRLIAPKRLLTLVDRSQVSRSKT